MSSYVSVLGTPTGETCCVFGLTPQEVRYLQVGRSLAHPWIGSRDGARFKKNVYNTNSGF